MFRNIVRVQDSPFSSDIADQYFSRITGNTFRNDCSFISTMRALLYQRMGEQDSIHVNWLSVRITKDEIDDMGPSDILNRAVCFDTADRDTLTIVNLNGNAEENKLIIDAISGWFEKKAPGYVKNEKVSAFFQKSFSLLCFGNTDIRSVVVFVDFMDIRKMHYIQMAILPMFPWYFDPSKGIPEDEMNLIKSLQDDSSDKYIASLNNLIKRYDLRSMKIKALLTGFEKRRFAAEIEVVKNEILSRNRSIDDYMDAIGDLLQEQEQSQIRLAGLEAAQASQDEDSEIMEYFCCNKKLNIRSVSDSTIMFYVTTYLSYFDNEMAKAMIDNECSCLYGYANDDDMKRFYEAVFIEEKIKIRICGAYKITFGGSAKAVSEFNFPADASTYLPNPHINNYNCIGNYARIFSELMREGKYIETIEQCVASCASINFGDSTVMRRFAEMIANDNREFVELPDGNIVSVSSAIEWLKEN